MSTSAFSTWFRSCALVSIVLVVACSSSPKGSGGIVGGSGGAGALGGSDGGAGTSGVTSQTVGTQGGTIALDGVVLTIPGDAVAADTVVTVSSTTAPAGYLIASAAYELAPAATTFAHPVSVTIPLTMTAPRAHLFLSNGSGGFEDRGGIVSGPIITAQITHFGTCFAATPSNDGGPPDVAGDAAVAKDGGDAAVGTDATGKDSGTAGSGAAGAGTAGGGAADAGAAGSGAAGSGAAGAGVAGAGSAGAGSGAAGSGGQTDAAQNSEAGAGAGSDGDADVASSQLCAATGLNAPVVAVTTITDGAPAPDGSTYTGGRISSGTYYLTNVIHYGSQYGGPQKSVRTFDMTAGTLREVDSPFLQGTVLYSAFDISNADDHTLSGALICSSAEAASTTWYYTATGTTLTMSQVGASDVAVYKTSL
jgi:hypothetical protein